jgi:tyrosyl-tRNA synthetase
MPLLEGLDGIEKMSKSKGNYVGITDDPNTMFARLMSISDDLMWRYFLLLSFRGLDEIERLKAQCAEGRNPRDAKVMLAAEIVTRFHDAGAAAAAEEDFNLRARGGIPQDIPTVELTGAPLAIATLLKAANLVASGAEAVRMIEQNGVRIDGATVNDRNLKLPAGTFVAQVGKRRFARVTLR